MRTPEFWDATPGLVAGLLTPVGAALDAASRVCRAFAHPYHASVPVICVGNIVVGGAGKTPVVLSLVEVLCQAGMSPHIVMRGYGGRLTGPVRVDPQTHDADAVGDEALLAATQAPTWVARDRAAGVRAAAKAGAGAVLFDDGFQNPSVVKDLALLVVDAAYGFGNGRLLPAGPLRERVDDGLARADAIVLLDGDTAPPGLAGTACPILRASLAPVDGGRLAGRRLVAFAGIGRPEKFFATLRGLGAELVAEHAFPDHHRFSNTEIAALHAAAERKQALLVTTAKDAARLRPQSRAGIEVLDARIEWRDRPALDALLARVLEARGAANG
ncbi:MAG TPA: tetraacyldisaccharide 4'-kinase [Stellaceae bacterium]|nr:tetraacyldisaccharide 4'-kinase [Stellaceae bacterium]